MEREVGLVDVYYTPSSALYVLWEKGDAACMKRCKTVCLEERRRTFGEAMVQSELMVSQLDFMMIRA